MPVPSSIGTADGYLLKTDKNKGFVHLTRGVENAAVPMDSQTLNIEDGNASFYAMKEVPGTYTLKTRVPQGYCGVAKYP
jgi:hypothetical protein